MGKISKALDVFFGGSGKSHDGGYNPYRHKAAVEPQIDSEVISGPRPATSAPAKKPEPQPDNPFEDIFGDDIDPTTPIAPDPQPSATADDDCDDDSVYRRTAKADEAKDQEDQPQDATIDQLFMGFAMRFYRTTPIRGGVNIFLDLIDVQEQYARENPDLSDDEINKLIWEDMNSGTLAVRPVALNFGGQAVRLLPHESAVGKLLAKLYEQAADTPSDQETQPTDTQTESQPQAEEAAPVEPPATPEPPQATSTQPKTPPEPTAEVVSQPAAEPSTPDTLESDVPYPDQPTPAVQPSKVDIVSIIGLIPEADRTQFYAQLAQAVVSSGVLGTAQDFASITAASQPTPAKSAETPLPGGFEPIQSPKII